MEEANSIFDYLPILYKTTAESEYVEFLWDSFCVNYEREKYQFAYIAYHMLFMCFVYFQLTKIYQNRPDELKNIMLFTDKAYQEILNHEKKAVNHPLDSLEKFNPFNFSVENESTIMGLFLSVGCDREIIRRMKSFVRERNNIAHSNGNIVFRIQKDLDDKIFDILDCVDCMQTSSKHLILDCFEQYLEESNNVEEREYIEDKDQIQEVLVHRNYLSQKDIALIGKYGPDEFAESEYRELASKMVEVLCEIYPDD